MRITAITFSLRNEDKLKAFVNVTFENCFLIRGLKVLKGDTGLFVTMPSRKMNDGTYRDIAHPVTNEFRERLERAILEKFEQVLKQTNSATTSDEMSYPSFDFRDIDAKQYDVFISHASEDKIEIARPLANFLRRRRLKVWLDDFELTVGDSLSRSIDQGLAFSRFGVVILSPNFFNKKWPRRELESLVAREDGKEKVILPVWHNVKLDDILKFSPALADKLAVPTTGGINHVGREILRAVRRPE
jgi:DNA-binding cell septation regulator SpoVG